MYTKYSSVIKIIEFGERQYRGAGLFEKFSKIVEVKPKVGTTTPYES